MGNKSKSRLDKPGAGEEAARIREMWGGAEKQQGWRAISPELLIDLSNLIGVLGRPGVAERVLAGLDEDDREDLGPADRLRKEAWDLSVTCLVHLPEDYEVFSV